VTGADPASIAERFVQAIVWGEHLTVWAMMSEAGREYVLEAGARRGLDPLQAQRIRQNSSSQDEVDSFLTGLVHGLRVDFSAVPLDEVRAGSQPIQVGADVVEVPLHCPATFGEGRWAAGSIMLSRSDDSWMVDRVKPLVSRSE
jgi:hypothetical protein